MPKPSSPNHLVLEAFGCIYRVLGSKSHVARPAGSYCTWAVSTNSKFTSGPQAHKPASRLGDYLTSAAWGSPTLQSAEQKQKWSPSATGGYVTSAACGVHNPSQRRKESEGAQHKCCGWLRNTCHKRAPQRFRAWEKIQKWPTSGPGGYATPAPWGSLTLQSKGQNQKWPTSGPAGYVSPDSQGVTDAS